jgi:hypothetical protein
MRLGAALTAAGTVAALAGCLLPWETITVGPAAGSGITRVGAPHGAGLLACAGACAALLVLAHRLRGPGRSELRDALEALAGTLLVLGSALFTSRGGYRPGGGPGWSVDLGPGLPITGIAGVALLAGLALSAAGRRAGERPPAG